MNDQHEPGPDDVDDAHAWVRDLLADARVEGSVPDHVAARLDETLAALQAERAASGAGPETGTGTGTGTDTSTHTGTVVPLRRRLPARLTAAAAAVIVLGAGGVAIAQLGGNGSAGSDATSSKSSAGTAGRAGSATASPSAPRSVSGAAPQALADSAIPGLTSAAFASDAARLMRQVAAQDAVAGTNGSLDAASPSAPVPAQTPAATPPQTPTDKSLGGIEALKAPAVTATPPGAELDLRGPASCSGPASADGVTLRATLDGVPVALVFRSPTADRQRVEAWSCDGSTLLRSAVITVAAQ